MSDHKASSSAMLSNKTYDTFQWMIRYFLPGVGTLYLTLSQIWRLPGGEQVLGTVTALALFFGVLMGLSNRTYTPEPPGIDGTLTIGDIENDGLVIDRTLDELENRDHITIAVKHPTN